jgi:hypothetical protein
MQARVIGDEFLENAKWAVSSQRSSIFIELGIKFLVAGATLNHGIIVYIIKDK